MCEMGYGIDRSLPKGRYRNEPDPDYPGAATIYCHDEEDLDVIKTLMDHAKELGLMDVKDN